MGNLQPAAAIGFLMQIGDARGDQFGHAQARVIGGAEQRRIAQAGQVRPAGQQRAQGRARRRALPFGHFGAEPQGGGLTLAMALLPSQALERVGDHARPGGKRFVLAKAQHAVRAGNARDAAGEGRGPGSLKLASSRRIPPLASQCR
jgi:hypothetical protein